MNMTRNATIRTPHPFERRLSDWRASRHDTGQATVCWAESLSAREAQVCLCFLEHMTHEQVAEFMGIDRRTLDFHIGAIIRKTFLASKTVGTRRSINEVLAVRSRESIVCDLRRRRRNKKPGAAALRV